MRLVAKTLNTIIRHILVFTLIFTWVFSSWPQMFPQFPPKTEEVKAQTQGTGWYDAAWTYRKKLTVNQSKVAGSATSFPVLVSATSTDWKYTTHGGYVATATASDILFTTADGISKLDHEIESYASSTGKLVAWVRLPYLSSATTNAIFIYYGNAAASDQQNETGVWDSNFKGVWHMTTTSSQTNISYDSTANSNTGTKFATNQPFSSSTGTINGAQDFDGTDDFIDAGNPASLQITGALTISAWVNKDAAAALGRIVAKSAGPGNRGYDLTFESDDKVYWSVAIDASNTVDINTANAVQIESWYHVTAIYEPSTKTAIYVNGIEATSTVTNVPASQRDASVNFNIARRQGCCNLDAKIDEVRVSNSVRSASWIQTEYNNQSSPETFFIIGNQESQWCSYNDSSWNYRKKITVAASKVAGAQANFPVLVNRTDADFRTTTNGGHVGSAIGYDFVFTSTDCTIKLDHEIEKFASSTGELIAWVRYPFLSTTSTNSFYVYYGNSSSPNQQNKTAVWDSSYKGVWHMTTTSSQTNISYDSTANSNTGTKFATNQPFSSSTGTINGAQDFDGVDDRVDVGSIADNITTGDISISAWFNLSTPFSSANSSNFPIFILGDETSTNDVNLRFIEADGMLKFGVYNGSFQEAASTQTSWSAGEWHHVAGILNTSSGMNLYLDGVEIGTNANTGRGSTVSLKAGIGDYMYAFPGNFNGVIDEVRVSNAARSATWIQTEYNNQFSPGRFLLFDSEEPLRGATASSRSDILSDSRPGQTSNHTLSFTVNNDITASTSLVFSWPDGFTMSAPTNWYSGNWSYRKKITIDGTKIAGNSDLTDFPVLVSSTQALWKSTANGGNVSSATGWDFVFTKADGITKLDHEIEKFASTTGELVAWFRAPTLDRNAANELYVYYGGPSTTNQQNKTGVWDSNFKGVWHMAATSTINATDSTSNSNNGFLTGSPTALIGQIDGAVDFSQSDSQSVTVPYNSNLAPTDAITFSGWFNANPTILNVVPTIIGNAESGGYFFGLNGISGLCGGSTTQFCGAVRVNGVYQVVGFGTDITGAWHYGVFTYDGTAVKGYVDGNLVGSVSVSGPIQQTTEPFCIGNNPSIGVCNDDPYVGRVDDVRISNTARSAAWIQTEYNNQSSPSTFHTIGNEEDNGIYDCQDVDVATGTEFTLGGVNDCWATASHWGVVFATSSRKLTLTAPTNEYTHVATGTQITVQIGTNATNQLQGNSRIANPSSAGTYNIALSGSAGSSGEFVVSINAGQLVSAVISESLAFTASSISSGACTADDGASITAISTTTTTIPFGSISANAFYIGCQDLIVSTNAGGGYSLTTQENRPMTAGSSIIPDTTCNTGTCTEATSAAWTTAANNGLGHTCFDQMGNDCNTVYNDGDNFRQFASMSAGETPQPIMASTTPAIATGRIKFRLSVGSGEAAGTYSNTVSYTLTGTY